jgi:tryptophan-rich sensory protein
MEALIVSTMAVSWRIDKRAAALLGPYALWVAFAGLLNEEIYRLNPPTAFAAHP